MLEALTAFVGDTRRFLFEGTLLHFQRVRSCDSFPDDLAWDPLSGTPHTWHRKPRKIVLRDYERSTHCPGAGLESPVVSAELRSQN